MKILALLIAMALADKPTGLSRAEILYAIETGGEFVCDDHPDVFADVCGLDNRP
jgi:hypothetical protein